MVSKLVLSLTNVVPPSGQRHTSQLQCHLAADKLSCEQSWGERQTQPKASLTIAWSGETGSTHT